MANGSRDRIVEAAQGLPVLAAGGIGRGSQILAALAMGCQGVWLGSLWLGTAESDLNIDMRERLFEASSEDAQISKAMTGKQGRMLRSRYTEAWEERVRRAKLAHSPVVAVDSILHDF